MPQPQDHSFVDVLAAEHAELCSLLDGLDEGEWESATPAEGWTVKDSVSHLAHTEELARHTATGGPCSLANEIERVGQAGVIPAGVDRGRALSGTEVLAWFEGAAAYDRAALGRVDVGLRVPWGLGMSWRSFVTARLMEAWAHGLDIRAGLERPAVDSDRLAHIAWLSLGSVPYALSVAGVEPPAGHSLRLELTGPAGQAWAYGPEEATDVIRGPAGTWCRRAVQRIAPNEAAAGITCDGPLAELAFRHARCFL